MSNKAAVLLKYGSEKCQIYDAISIHLQNFTNAPALGTL